MTKLTMFDQNGKESGELAVSAELFGQEMNETVVHSALTWFLAARRRGTQSALTRTEVRGGGKKPWRQKGTGRARAGSSRSPLWRGGGVIFAPKPRSYNYSFPKKARKLALKVALSDKVREGKVKLLDSLEMAPLKTREAAGLLKKLQIAGKTLIVLGQESKPFRQAAQNLADVTLVTAGELNIHDLLYADWLVIEKTALAGLEGILN